MWQLVFELVQHDEHVHQLALEVLVALVTSQQLHQAQKPDFTVHAQKVVVSLQGNTVVKNLHSEQTVCSINGTSKTQTCAQTAQNQKHLYKQNADCENRTHSGTHDCTKWWQ